MHFQQLRRECVLDEVFQLAHIQLFLSVSLICHFESLVIGAFVVSDLFGNRFCSWEFISKENAQNSIRDSARSASVSVIERMDPIDPPQKISGKVHRRFIAEMFVHVVTHLFDAFRHGVGGWRVMTTLAYFHLIDTECTGEWIESLNGDSI